MRGSSPIPSATWVTSAPTFSQTSDTMLINGYKLIVEKSTVPAITAEWIKKTVGRYAAVSEKSAEAEFDVASNPEFL